MLNRPCLHFSGNFWWANTKHIKTLDTAMLKGKMDAEWWVLSNNPNSHSLFNSNKDHFINRFPPEQYNSQINNDVEYISICHPDGKSGLCNQIMSLISGILLAIESKKTTIVVGEFNLDNKVGGKVPSKDIFDFNSMNLLLSKYKIKLVDMIDIERNLSNIKFSYHFLWINQGVKAKFEEFTRYIRFNPTYYELANKPLSILGTNFNTIHIRTEEDAINHWSKQNRMTIDQFKTSLEEIYIKKIGLHFTKSIPILLLTSDTNSPIVNYLKEQGYTYYVTDKVLKGREVNAIVDLILGSQTTNHFIGNFNNELLRGSSFSYSILQLLKPTCIYTPIDIDNLHA
jgi:hypothetical protein